MWEPEYDRDDMGIAGLHDRIRELEEQIADLKRQLESLQDAWRELRRAHGKTVGELNESRAHAEALAEALEKYLPCERCDGDGEEPWSDNDVTGPAACSACQGMGFLFDGGKTAVEALTAYRKYKEPGERQCIVCAALKLPDGTIVCGPRHFDQTMHATLERMDKVLATGKHRAEQGFVDQWGTFLDRRAAMQVAVASEQVSEDAGDILYSEHLY